MIPVLICPIIGDFDLVERMLDSIDVPVGRLVIVDNSLTGWKSQGARSIEYIRPITGLGYPGGINAGISQTPEAPWWVWCNADLSFGPGDLAHIAAVMEEATGPRHVTGSHRGLRNAYGAMNAACIEAAGLFDDWSFYPIYYDDDDYQYRCGLAGVEWVAYDGGIRHLGSRTLDDPAYREANGRTYPRNAAAYVAKWGGLPGDERYDSPWDSDLPVWVTRPDPAGRGGRLWETATLPVGGETR